MIEKVLFFPKLEPPHPEAGIVAQRMAFEATTRNLSKVTFIEKPSVVVVGNTARKIHPQVQGDREAIAKLKEFRRQQAEKPPIVPIKKQLPPRLMFSFSLKPGQLFEIEAGKGIYRVITIGDGQRGRWVIAQHSQTCEPFSFHVSQFEVVMAYAEPPKVEAVTIPEPSPTLYDLNKVMILGPQVESIIQLPTVLASIGKPITALTQEDFRAGNLPTLDETIIAWNAEEISTAQFKAIRNAIGLHRDPEMFLAVEEMIHETA